MSDKNYWWLLFVALCSAFFYGLNLIERKYRNKWHLIRRYLYGVGGSCITTYSVCEILVFLGAPANLAIILGGACGYIGAEVFTKILVAWIEKKLNIKINKNDSGLSNP